MENKDVNILSISEQQIPFLQKNDCTRVEMACNQMRQAISLTKPEIPLIKSGYEATYTQYSSYVIKAPKPGRCIYKDDEIMYVKYNVPESEKKAYLETETNDISLDTSPPVLDDVINLKHNSYLGFDRTLYPTINEDDRFEANDVLACCSSINQNTGELMLGKNLLVGFLSSGWNFEDAIIISETAAEKLKYHEVFQDRLEIDDEVLLSLKDDTYDPVRNSGSHVNEGDVLFKLSISNNENISSLIPCYREIIAPISGQLFTNVFVRKRQTNSILMNKWLRLLEETLEPQENKKMEMFANSPNVNKYKNKYCYGHMKRKINAKTCTIDYTIVKDKKASIGCKIANRHGNKGVVSIIKPDNEMPTLPNGTPLEVIFNPLGVISRMNIGQLFEIHVTWAMHNFIKQISNLIPDDFLDKCIEFISIIDNTPNKDYTEKSKVFIKNLNNNEKNYLVEDIKTNGLQIIQPPFYSCTHEQLDELMTFTNTPYTEKVRLENGMVVDCAVGFMYLLRLQHEPDHKIFARSVGAYGKHEQAPSGSNAHRIGEMEVWSLLAYESYDTIKEFLSIKADNPEERYRHFIHLYDGHADYYEPKNFETITHETFKTYLKGSGLKVTF
jgi:DNA-directed RNA polymerase subunit beta